MSKLKILILCVVALMAQGCSSMFLLYVHNLGSSPIHVHSVLKVPKPERDSIADFELAPGAQEEAAGWFGVEPLSFEVTVTDARGTRHAKFTHATFPAAMQSRSSAGCPIHLYIDDGMRLEGPTASERFQANLPVYVFGSCCCLFWVGLTWVIVAQQRRLQRPR